MLAKIEKIISRCCLLFIGIILILVGSLYTWAITGTRDLGSYIPDIETSISKVLGGNDVKIGKVELSWGGLEERLKIEALDTVVSLDDLDNSKEIKIKRIDLDFDLLSLVRGELIPQEVIIYDSEFIIPKTLAGGDSEEASMSQISTIDHIGIVNSKIKIEAIDKEFLIKNADLHIKKMLASYSAVMQAENSSDIMINGQVELENSGFKNAYVKTNKIKLNDIIDAKGIDLSAEIELTLQSDKANNIGVNLTNVSGNLKREELRDELELVTGKADFDYDLANSAVDIKHADIEFVDGVQVELKGQLLDIAEPNIDIKSVVKNLDLKNLHRYWPADLGNNAIEWIDEHIKAGTIAEARAEVKLNPEMIVDGVLLDEAVKLVFDFSNLSVDYKPGLTPVKNGVGKATMNTSSIVFELEKASLGKSNVFDSIMTISDIGITDGFETLAISGKIKGDVQDLGSFYDKLAKGKKYLKQEDIIAGNYETNLDLKFPLDKNLKIEDVKIDLKSKVEKAVINNFLDVMNTKLFEVSAEIDDIETSVKGSFVGYPKIDNDYVKISDLPIAFDLGIKNKKETLNIIADLNNTELSLPMVGVNKKMREKATLKVKKIAQNGSSYFENISFSSNDLNFKATGIGSFSAISELNFSELTLPGSNLVGSFKDAGGKYIANFTATNLNVAPLLDHIDAEGSGNEFKESVEVALTAERLLLKNEESLSNIKLAVGCVKGDCDDISFKFDGGLMTSESSNGDLKVRLNDTGRVLKGFDFYEYLEKGKLVLNANKADGIYTGRVTIKDFNIVKGKILPRILAIGSLTGIADLLQGNGVSFTKLSADFVKKEGFLDVKNFKMYGSALGLTANGYIDFENDKIKLSGNVIPSYTANTILGRIPILGDLIIGDEGIFAIAYKVTGSLEDPEVNVNPLSVLAPGIIKNVFN